MRQGDLKGRAIKFWDYDFPDGHMVSFITYCPVCGNEVLYREEPAVFRVGGGYTFDFRCKRCVTVYYPPYEWEFGDLWRVRFNFLRLYERERDKKKKRFIFTDVWGD